MFLYSLEKDKWIEGTEETPTMTSARLHHSSCALDDKLYVIGGFGEDLIPLNSIEFLKIDERAYKKQGWTLVRQLTDQILERETPVVCQLSANKILVMGGNNLTRPDRSLIGRASYTGDYERYKKEVLVIDSSDNQAYTVLEDIGFRFATDSQPFQVGTGIVVAQVYEDDGFGGNTLMLKYDYFQNTLVDLLDDDQYD